MSKWFIERQLRKSGNSYVLSIPKCLMTGIPENATIVFAIHEDGSILIYPKGEKP